MDDRVVALNEELRVARCKAKLKQRGESLSLQATLPPKPGSSKQLPYQQEIRLGYSTTKEGLRQARAAALRLSGEIEGNKFDWSRWTRQRAKPAPRTTIGDWITRFEKDYRSKHQIKNSTWNCNFLAGFKKLDWDSDLSIEELKRAIERTEPDTKIRRNTCAALESLAKFAGLTVDLSSYQGNYGPSKVFRELPTDKEIVEAWGEIPNPSWRWVFGMMAAFGLRNHEVFFCHFERQDSELSDWGLQVERGKTGPRYIPSAFYPEWLEQFELLDRRVPDMQDLESLYERSKIGSRVSRQLARYNIPFKPYVLRHAMAIRLSVVFRLPVTTSAAIMGHRPDEHLRTYHKHINQATNREAVDRVLRMPDRPKPPTLEH